ncbi:MAG TPA: hypothetical protein VES97_12490 [Solirubrobacteraceae bacterium]|nr:hypothetical protein [Solirubrobacteraceae bacterium]
MKRRYTRKRWHWIRELLKGPTDADLDYRRILGATLALAQSKLSDEEARRRLHKIAAASEFDTGDLVREFERRRDNYVRDSYLGDRAYRLAMAVMTGRAVESPDPALGDQFHLEEELGRLPLEAAFDRLTSVAPGLGAWRTAVEDGLVMHVPELRRLKKTVGPDASQSNAVVRSHIAIAVATAYLSVLVSNADRGDLKTPYFEMVQRPNATVLTGGGQP